MPIFRFFFDIYQISQNFILSINGMLNRTSKKITFNEQASVTFIPTQKEYRNAGLAGDLWYTSKEYDKMEIEAKKEVNQCARENKISTKAAIEKLYQYETWRDVDPSDERILISQAELNRSNLSMFEPLNAPERDSESRNVPLSRSV